MKHTFYSQRNGLSRHPQGLPLRKFVDLFARLYQQLEEAGYFQEAFGKDCTDGFLSGNIVDPEMDIMLTVNKDNLWPLSTNMSKYAEDDLLDLIEYLYQHVSNPVSGHRHDWNDCGMHYSTFDKATGQQYFREKVNALLGLYAERFELTKEGLVLRRVEEGFEQIFTAQVPTQDNRIEARRAGAVAQFRRHGSTHADRRQAVRDLVDILELLRPQVKAFLTSKDEGDLFNIANNFGIRHFNDKQQTNYDEALWLSWMFYFYLSTIHVVTRKMEQAANATQGGSEPNISPQLT